MKAKYECNKEAIIAIFNALTGHEWRKDGSHIVVDFSIDYKDSVLKKLNNCMIKLGISVDDKLIALEELGEENKKPSFIKIKVLLSEFNNKLTNENLEKFKFFLNKEIDSINSKISQEELNKHVPGIQSYYALQKQSLAYQNALKALGGLPLYALSFSALKDGLSRKQYSEESKKEIFETISSLELQPNLKEEKNKMLNTFFSSRLELDLSQLLCKGKPTEYTSRPGKQYLVFCNEKDYQQAIEALKEDPALKKSYRRASQPMTIEIMDRIKIKDNKPIVDMQLEFSQKKL